MQLYYSLLEQKKLERENDTSSAAMPTVIIPGLFGSSTNWRSFGQQLSEDCSVYLIDQRNHGRSPHANSHSYADMVQDLHQFLVQQDLEKINLCGHSMGGKVAMLFALLYPEKVNKLIVLDIAPIKYEHTHAPFLEALMAIDLTVLKSRSEADRAVSMAIPDTATRLFLLQSLTGAAGHYSWRLNLSVLKDYMPDIIGFPHHLVSGKQAFMPVLCLYGEDSNYVLPDSNESIKIYFPEAQIDGIADAGHWLHVQQPKKVLEAIKKFIKNDK